MSILTSWLWGYYWWSSW